MTQSPKSIKLCSSPRCLWLAIREQFTSSITRAGIKRPLEQGNRTVALDPNFAPAHWRLFEVYTQLGKLEEAISEKEKAWLLMGESRGVVLPAIAGIRQAVAKSGARGFWQEEAEVYKNTTRQLQSHVSTRGSVTRMRLSDGWTKHFNIATVMLRSLESIRPLIPSAPIPATQDLVRRIGLPMTADQE